ncbi:MAG TPA: DUF1646 family protein [Candidatus Omnitrophota bacterium]|nr:DUF1646 family protein [Candidatus Omnitrophota bacterium]HPD84551.1 DUF1646 family protein [Candidatus Omnitrophota bacterium]HRZ03409.1 DUF1646 family protein [Candidatus Omnitrophota bacterium]
MILCYAGLFAILAMVLVLPFLIKKIEQELELFLFLMGCAAVTVSAQWNAHLIKEALLEPVKITLAVLVAGFLFQRLQASIAGHVERISRTIGIKAFAFLMIAGLGFLSSVITAIIASLILAEVIHYLKVERKTEIKLVILACFSIGFGAALTPIGEPLSTIAIAKLKGQPYEADFFFLAKHLGQYILSGVLIFGLLGMIVSPAHYQKGTGLREDKREGAKDIFIRTGKVYLFIMALIFLGSGFKPIIDAFISKVPYRGLYWINMISAVLDNATLAAAEIGPALGILQIKAALLGLLISGGMLIPGNIPNIISAGKLKIKSSEWAAFGVPLGLIVMTIYFFLLK